ncbi:MAG: hypothetical protein QM750_09245 [Rubrivivax sp.]
MPFDSQIEALNLECVTYKVCRDEGWSLEKADRIERSYRAFLQIIRDCGSPEDIAPTTDIDTYWHHHILDTKLYARDCEAIFGYFLHHYPYSGIFSEIDATAQRQRVIRSNSMINDKLNLLDQ